MRDFYHLWMKDKTFEEWYELIHTSTKNLELWYQTLVEIVT